MLQEIFGAPHGKVILAVTVCKKPAARSTPEPLVARSIAPLFLELSKASAKQEGWTVTSWSPYVSLRYPKKPYVTITAYGREAEDHDLSAELQNSPWHELSAASQDASLPLDKLPAFLKTMQSGTSAEREALILGLHRRLFHKEAAELRQVLARSGVPLTVLSTVEEILSKCQTCQQWRKGHARPVVKTRQALRFNHTIYADLVFFSTFMVAMFVDESIRIVALGITPSKEEEDLEKIFRRLWIGRYGPPRIFRSDKEGAFTSDAFRLFLERYGTQRELVTASDSHTWLGILDRRVQLLRTIVPKLAEELSQEAIICDPEDYLAEAEYCLNTQLSYGGYSPYEVLHGVNPTPIFDDESEFQGQLGVDSIPFYEHQLVRAKAIAAFHSALLQNGLSRAMKARPRKEAQQLYKVGSWVDCWRRPSSKAQSGWRGPAVVIAPPAPSTRTGLWRKADANSRPSFRPYIAAVLLS